MLKDVQTLHLLAEHRLFTRARPFGNLPDAFHAAMWEIMNTENFSCMVLANWDFSTTDYTLEVRGCDGMNKIQAWIAKHTFTPNLVVDGVEEIRPQLLGGVHYFEVHLNDEVPNPELSFDKLDQMNCKYLLLHLDLIPENCKALLEPVFVWLGRARLNWGTYLRLELSASRRFPSGFCFCAKWELVKKAVEENGTLKVEAMEMKRRDETDEIEMHVLIRNK
ncbi:hypothetical protein C8R43DRAFT_951293 [Mycena crocata]|nr:hypothetical protein C8R43DRAFT_951293 [Mycena crocata]